MARPVCRLAARRRRFGATTSISSHFDVKRSWMAAQNLGAIRRGINMPHPARADGLNDSTTPSTRIVAAWNKAAPRTDVEGPIAILSRARCTRTRATTIHREQPDENLFDARTDRMHAIGAYCGRAIRRTTWSSSKGLDGKGRAFPRRTGSGDFNNKLAKRLVDDTKR